MELQQESEGETRPWVQLSDYIPFIDEDANSEELDKNCSASQVPKSSNSTTVLQKHKGTELPNGKKELKVLEEEAVKESDAISSRMATSAISAHSSLPRPGKELGMKFAAATTSQCQDDSSVVWLGRYPNSYVAGPIGGVGANPYPPCGYELSDTFQQKQIEMLERKYGGHYRAHRSATLIQRAFREHCLAKKWKQVCNPSRRRMHRIQTVDLASPTRPTVSAHPFAAASHLISPRVAENYQSLSGRRELTMVASDGRGKERESTGLNNPPTGLRLHKYNVDNRPHLSAPLSAQLRAASGQKKMDENQAPRRIVRVQAPDNRVPQEPAASSRKVPAVRVISKPRSVSAERHRNHRMGARVRVIPVVATQRDEGAKKPMILSQESEILQDSSSPSQSPTTRFALENLSSGHKRVLPSRPSDTSLLSQESQGSSNSGNSSSGCAGTGGGRVQPDWTDRPDLLPSYLTYAEFKEATRSPRDVPRVKCQRSVAHLPISASTVLPLASGWTSGSELDTPSSDTGSSASFGGAYTHYGTRAETVRSSSPRVAGLRSGVPVWIPMPDKVKTVETASHHAPLHGASSDSILSTKNQAAERKSPVGSDPELRRAGKTLGMGMRMSSRHKSELERKRHYRIALNFFNKKPDRGMQFLMEFGFVDSDPAAVAKFLMTRRGLSKQMIGEYLGNLQSAFNASVLECFVALVDLRNMEVDVALRKFQAHFRFPGEAQKIERIIEVFSRHYCACNPESVAKFRQADSVFILSFAVIMLNTDLHSPNIKQERRMKLSDFLKNLKGIDDGADLDQRTLAGIYQRVKEEEFKPGTDHVTQVMKVDRSIVGKKPVLSLPHRRLVCYCRLYEVDDPQKRQSPNVHQREIFLFNDILVITKILSRKKSGVTYSYRQSHSLVGMQVHPFRTQYFPQGLRIHHTLENKVLLFNARSEDDKIKFMEDLKESILESDQMEALRIELELEKQSLIRPSLGRCDSQRDSGLPDIGDEGTLRKGSRALSNSLLELAGGVELSPQKHPARSGSINSLDSGMSSTASVESREMSPKGGASKDEEEFGGSLFGLVGNGVNTGTLRAEDKNQRAFQQSSTSSDV